MVWSYKHTAKKWNYQQMYGSQTADNEQEMACCRPGMPGVIN
jgi:hypothetical protein